MTARATLATAADGERVLFRCPGCEDNHQIHVGTWTFNGDLERPTITPSLLVHGNQWPEDEYPEYYRASHASVAPGGDTICHSFVTDGRIQFLSDSTHVLAGQTVDLPEWAP